MDSPQLLLPSIAYQRHVMSRCANCGTKSEPTSLNDEEDALVDFFAGEWGPDIACHNSGCTASVMLTPVNWMCM